MKILQTLNMSIVVMHIWLIRMLITNEKLQLANNGYN
jgi:hypothetical protein